MNKAPKEVGGNSKGASKRWGFTLYDPITTADKPETSGDETHRTATLFFVFSV